MYENKCINLLTAGKFYFLFSYSASLFVFVFVFFVIPAKEEKVLYSNKNLIKDIQIIYNSLMKF